MVVVVVADLVPLGRMGNGDGTGINAKNADGSRIRKTNTASSCI